jgi:general stress protein 26
MRLGPPGLAPGTGHFTLRGRVTSHCGDGSLHVSGTGHFTLRGRVATSAKWPFASMMGASRSKSFGTSNEDVAMTAGTSGGGGSVRRVSRRDQIKMTDAEVLAFLGEERIVVCATNGKDGFPHLMPLWYVVRDGELWAWTFAKSQKVKNLERDARATLQVEAGDSYDQLRGVMFKTEVEIVRDTELVAGLGMEIFAKYTGGDLGDEVRAMVLKQAEKRVGMRFAERERATWDHRKLAAGVY